MLISPEYQALNAQMMRDHDGFAVEGHKYARRVAGFARRIGARTILDYGAGRQTLKEALSELDFDIRGYDPAVPDLSATPVPADLVTCTDVLEHIEPDCLGEVLADLRRCAVRGAYLIVTTQPARKLLPDGTNPHRIIRPAHWWHTELSGHFEIAQMTAVKMNKRYEFLCA